jgi:hypothetical protein
LKKIKFGSALHWATESGHYWNKNPLDSCLGSSYFSNALLRGRYPTHKALGRGHFQNNQPPAFHLEAILCWECPCPGALPYTSSSPPPLLKTQMKESHCKVKPYAIKAWASWQAVVIGRRVPYRVFFFFFCS